VPEAMLPAGYLADPTSYTISAFGLVRTGLAASGLSAGEVVALDCYTYNGITGNSWYGVQLTYKANSL